MSRSGRIVVDASVALSVLSPMEREGPVALHLQRLARQGWTFTVPEFFWLEIANALGRRHGWTGDRIVEAIHSLEEMRFETAATDRSTFLLAIDHIERFGLTAYDAIYLALAESMDVPLLTADAELAAAAGSRAIAVLAEGVAERSPPFERRPTWPSWPGAAAYLAELRAEHARPSRRTR